MDVHQFDDLSRTLSFAASRRGALAGLGSVLLTGWLPVHCGEEAAAKKKGKNKKKKKKRQKGGSGGTQPPPSLPPPPPAPDCVPACADSEACQGGRCVCVPICATSNACGPDGCNGSCGSCSTEVTCQGTTFTRQVCDGGTCTPVTRPCESGQVCFQNACCMPQPPSSCRTSPVSAGCGVIYPANCLTHCCDTPGGGLVCQEDPCL